MTGFDSEELRRLEESLWRPGTRFDREHMERVLADDFVEFGRSGRAWTREEIMGMTAEEIPVQLPLPRFAAHPVAPGVALVTYLSVVTRSTVDIANRSSLWVRHGDRWRLRFHQGTPAAL